MPRQSIATRAEELRDAEPLEDTCFLGPDRPQSIVVTYEHLNGQSGRMKVASPDLEDMQNPNEIVIHRTKIIVYVEFPLNYPTWFKVRSEGVDGFRRRELFAKVCNIYKAVYAGEEAVAGDPGYIPGTYNRNTSNGPYGIRDHYIGDLVLHKIAQTRLDGYMYALGVDS